MIVTRHSSIGGKHSEVSANISSRVGSLRIALDAAELLRIPSKHGLTLRVSLESLAVVTCGDPQRLILSVTDMSASSQGRERWSRSSYGMVLF